MIDYETYARIHDCRNRQGLTITQIARTLGLHRETVAKWLARPRFERPRPRRERSSVLDPFKGRVTRLLDTHPYSAQQIFQRLREEGYGGGITILRDYVRLRELFPHGGYTMLEAVERLGPDWTRAALRVQRRRE